jgi:hypothetical protein
MRTRTLPELKICMEYLWKKLEKEHGRKISKKIRMLTLSSAVDIFLRKDLRYFSVDGILYTKNPEEFREALIRDCLKKFIGGDDELSTTDQRDSDT